MGWVLGLGLGSLYVVEASFTPTLSFKVLHIHSVPIYIQGNEAVNARSGDASAKKTKAGEVLSTPHQLKGRLVSPGISPINQANSADQTSPWPKDDISRFLTKEVVGAKRKNSTLGSKSKRPRVETEELIELKLTWELAQGLFRPPPNNVSSVVVIEGFEFEEYEVLHFFLSACLTWSLGLMLNYNSRLHDTVRMQSNFEVNKCPITEFKNTSMNKFI